MVCVCVCGVVCLYFLSPPVARDRTPLHFLWEAPSLCIKKYSHHDSTKNLHFVCVSAIINSTCILGFQNLEMKFWNHLKSSLSVGSHIQLITNSILQLQYFATHILAISVMHEYNDYLQNVNIKSDKWIT